MWFHSRTIKRNESTRFPSSVMVVDTETYPTDHPTVKRGQLHKLRLWCASHFRFEKSKVTRQSDDSGQDIESFWRFVQSKLNRYKPLYIFAHNLGFDLTVLRFWRELDENRLSLVQPAAWRGSEDEKRPKRDRFGILCLNDPPTIIECWKHGGRERIVFLDTLNYWRCPLASLGEDLGMTKLPMPGEVGEHEDWLRYCKQDVAILKKAVITLEDFIRTNDAGVFKYTISSQAMASYKHKFMHHEISIHREEEPLLMEREAYRGGETLMGYCGLIGGTSDLFEWRPAGTNGNQKAQRPGPIFVFDVQSFYPSVMIDNLFPVRLQNTIVSPPMDKFAELLESRFCVARVQLATKAESYPVLFNGQSIMANGQFVTTLCGQELVNAYRRKHIRHIGRCCWYFQEKIFTEFMSYWLDKREEYKLAGKREMEAMVKTLVCSLFGKWGQRKERWVDRPDIRSPQPWGLFMAEDWQSDHMEWFRSICWRTQMASPEGEANESFPAIAAAVTSYGRCRMQELREICGIGNFLYQDTDSIHCTETGANNLIAAGVVKENAVGMLSLKGKYLTGEYRGLKDYTLDGRHTVAGIKKDAETTANGCYRQLDFQRLSSILSAEPVDGVLVTDVDVPPPDRLPLGSVDRWGVVSPPFLTS